MNHQSTSHQELRIRNSLTGKKEVFEPFDSGHVTIYACGVTTYDHCHIGHAMQAIAFQMIKRYLQYLGYKVTYVRNYTDVDDKIIARASELDIEPLELSEQMIASSVEDMAQLGLQPADHEPRVSATMGEIIQMIAELVEKGVAYSTSEGNVYYRLSTKPDYGKLSHQKIEDMLRASRELSGEGKEDPLDFALWKASQHPTCSWSSPWGRGRPGWHIECSAMIRKYLGEQIDIHGGGRDLIFPHHENEVAQSEALCPHPWVKYWAHSGLLTVNGQKMSKSLGNHIAIKDFLAQRPAEVLKLCFLQHHYRQDVDLSEQSFKEAEEQLFGFYQVLADIQDVADTNPDYARYPLGNQELSPASLDSAFRQAMNDDFNTVALMAKLHSWFHLARQQLASLSGREQKLLPVVHGLVEFRNFLGKISPIIGIFHHDPYAYLTTAKERFLVARSLSAQWIEEQLKARLVAKANQNWHEADKLRQVLLDHNIEIRDQKNSSTWTIGAF